MVKFILITSKDPWDAPTGGTSAFARQLLEVFLEDIAIVSRSGASIDCGLWTKREFGNAKINFFKLGDFSNKKKIVPSRLTYLNQLRKYRFNIQTLKTDSIFIDSPEPLFVLSPNWNNVCYFFHGLNNPISHGRFRFLQPLGATFLFLFIRRLAKFEPKCILAASDQKTINEFYNNTDFNNKVGKINSFPTRVDDEIFRPIEDTKSLKRKYDIEYSPLFVVTGRLAKIKGWELILEAFKLYNNENKDSGLIFVGDGEDRTKILHKIKNLDLEGMVQITGFVPPITVADYINIADLCLVGSYREGWSVAMCEILACGKGMVSTQVSGADDMVINNKNGYIVNSRAPIEYASAMKNALNLKDRESISHQLSKKFLLKNLKEELLNYWKL